MNSLKDILPVTRTMSISTHMRSLGQGKFTQVSNTILCHGTYLSNTVKPPKPYVTTFCRSTIVSWKIVPYISAIVAIYTGNLSLVVKRPWANKCWVFSWSVNSFVRGKDPLKIFNRQIHLEYSNPNYCPIVLLAFDKKYISSALLSVESR